MNEINKVRQIHKKILKIMEETDDDFVLICAYCFDVVREKDTKKHIKECRMRN